MPDGSLLVNVARGGVVDTDALVARRRRRADPGGARRHRPRAPAADHPLWAQPGRPDHPARRRGHRRRSCPRAVAPAPGTARRVCRGATRCATSCDGVGTASGWRERRVRRVPRQRVGAMLGGHCRDMGETIVGDRDAQGAVAGPQRRTAATWEARGTALPDERGALPAVRHQARDARGSSWGSAPSHWGPSLQHSDDLGATWVEHPEGSIRFPEDTDTALKATWQLVADPHDPEVVWAGTEPQGLWRSADGGETFELNRGLWEHPHRPEWGEGFGGGAIHTVLPSPADAEPHAGRDEHRRRLQHPRRRRSPGSPATPASTPTSCRTTRGPSSASACTRSPATAPPPPASTRRTTGASTAPTTTG